MRNCAAPFDDGDLIVSQAVELINQPIDLLIDGIAATGPVVGVGLTLREDNGRTYVNRYLYLSEVGMEQTDARFRALRAWRDYRAESKHVLGGREPGTPRSWRYCYLRRIAAAKRAQVHPGAFAGVFGGACFQHLALDNVQQLL